MEVISVEEQMPMVPKIHRTAGIHLSQITNYITTEIMGKTIRKDQDIETFYRRAQLGFAWEEMLSLAWAGALGLRPGEVQKDGIIGSPDGISFSQDRLIVDEYKATWKSMRHPVTDNIRWMMQVKSYCKMVGTNYCRMRILYINGDYKPPIPQYRSYLLAFTDAELDENWEMILNHKDCVTPEEGQ